MDATVPKEKKRKNGVHTLEASNQALEYAQLKLHDLHDDEIWELAERLDIVMKDVVVDYIKEIRK